VSLTLYAWGSELGKRFFHWVTMHDITVSKNRSSKSACRRLHLLDLYFLHVK